MFHWTRAIQKVGSHQRGVLAKQSPTGPSLGGLSDYLYKENFKAMLQQDQGFPRGDVSLIMDVQADSFTFSYAGKKYSKAEFPALFQKVWLQVKASFKKGVESLLVIQDLVDGDKLQKPSLSITTRVVYEVGSSITGNRLELLECLQLQWKDVTFVTSEIVGPTHSGVLLSVLQNGKYLWSKLELKQTGNTHSCS